MINPTHITVYGKQVELFELNGTTAHVYELNNGYLQMATYHITKLYEI